MVDVDEVDYTADQPQQEESDSESMSSQVMLRAHEIVSSNLYDAVARDEGDDKEVELEQRPGMANPVQARLINQFLSSELSNIDAALQRDRDEQEAAHQKQQVKEEPFLSPEEPEVKTYQEELEERKKADISTQPSSSKFLSMLKPECDDPTTEGQVKIEQMCEEKGITSCERPFQNKMPTALDKPLEAGPRVKVNVPKPEPRGSEQSSEENESAPDGLAMLDKQYESKGFGFYGKHFRQTHGIALNFVKYRKAEPIQHPQALFDLNEKDFVDTYCNLFVEKPTPDEYFNKKAIVYSRDDH